MFLGLALVRQDHVWHTGFTLWTIFFCLVYRFISEYHTVLPSGISAPLRYDWFGPSSSVSLPVCQWVSHSRVYTQCCPVVLLPHSGMIGLDHLLLLVYQFVSEYHTVGCTHSVVQWCYYHTQVRLVWTIFFCLVYRFISEYHTVLPSGVSAPLRYDWFGPSSSVWSTGSSVSSTQCCPVVLVPHSGTIGLDHLLLSGLPVHQWVSHSVAQWC